MKWNSHLKLTEKSANIKKSTNISLNNAPVNRPHNTTLNTAMNNTLTNMASSLGAKIDSTFSTERYRRYKDLAREKGISLKEKLLAVKKIFSTFAAGVCFVLIFALSLSVLDSDAFGVDQRLMYKEDANAKFKKTSRPLRTFVISPNRQEISDIELAELAELAELTGTQEALSIARIKSEALANSKFNSLFSLKSSAITNWILNSAKSYFEMQDEHHSMQNSPKPQQLLNGLFLNDFIANYPVAKTNLLQKKVAITKALATKSGKPVKSLKSHIKSPLVQNQSENNSSHIYSHDSSRHCYNSSCHFAFISSVNTTPSFLSETSFGTGYSAFPSRLIKTPLADIYMFKNILPMAEHGNKLVVSGIKDDKLNNAQLKVAGNSYVYKSKASKLEELGKNSTSDKIAQMIRATNPKPVGSNNSSKASNDAFLKFDQTSSKSSKQLETSISKDSLLSSSKTRADASGSIASTAAYFTRKFSSLNKASLASFSPSNLVYFKDLYLSNDFNNFVSMYNAAVENKSFKHDELSLDINATKPSRKNAEDASASNSSEENSDAASDDASLLANLNKNLDTGTELPSNSATLVVKDENDKDAEPSKEPTDKKPGKDPVDLDQGSDKDADNNSDKDIDAGDVDVDKPIDLEEPVIVDPEDSEVIVDANEDSDTDSNGDFDEVDVVIFVEDADADFDQDLDLFIDTDEYIDESDVDLVIEIFAALDTEEIYHSNIDISYDFVIDLSF